MNKKIYSILLMLTVLSVQGMNKEMFPAQSMQKQEKKITNNNILEDYVLPSIIPTITLIILLASKYSDYFEA